MSRFVLSSEAGLDIEQIQEYLDGLPAAPAMRIGMALHRTLESIGANSLRGMLESELTRILGLEVRSRFVGDYRIIYRLGESVPEIVGILHGARDIATIMRSRLQ